MNMTGGHKGHGRHSSISVIDNCYHPGGTHKASNEAPPSAVEMYYRIFIYSQLHLWLAPLSESRAQNQRVSNLGAGFNFLASWV